MLAKDVVASLTRWMARDSMGLMVKALQKELTAVDDRTVKLVLSAPYPKMLLALGKNNTPIAFIMPERIAKTDPFQQITEYIGSGPMKFARAEWVPGGAPGSRLMKVEQSNSSIAYGERIFLKLYRRLEAGTNPDAEITRYALQHGLID